MDFMLSDNCVVSSVFFLTTEKTCGVGLGLGVGWLHRSMIAL